MVLPRRDQPRSHMQLLRTPARAVLYRACSFRCAPPMFVQSPSVPNTRFNSSGPRFVGTCLVIRPDSKNAHCLDDTAAEALEAFAVLP